MCLFLDLVVISPPILHDLDEIVPLQISDNTLNGAETNSEQLSQFRE